MEVLRCNESLLEPGDLPCANSSDIDAFVERLQYEVWTNSEKDFFEAPMKKTGRQIRRQSDMILKNLIVKDRVHQSAVHLRQNEIEVEGGLVSWGQTTYEDTFFDLARITHNMAFAPKSNPHLLGQTFFLIDKTGLSLQRENYCLNDFFGDLGGVFEVILFFLGIFM